uniref:Reverse transcriptase domain-containing protein n=1 Tax=Tanacetum cinerariifolium TaxID=118510 RepID=A0A6L2JEJ1_TANCI|nr:hypothetical protein [Tanacetum cinerariifolium]
MVAIIKKLMAFPTLPTDGDDVVIISSDKVEGSRDWNSPEYQDTTVSKGKKVINTLSFYRMETYEISVRYIAPCFVNGLEAYDCEVNLEFDENLISNEFAVKLCLDYEVKKGKILVKKELIVALKGELYFGKFIINLEEDDFKPEVILGRSFPRLANGVVDFGNGVITIYPEPDPFKDDYEKTGKSSDDLDQLLDFNFNDVPKFGEELPLFICKMRKRNRNKNRTMEKLNLFYQDIGPSSLARGHLTQEDAAKEALAVRISQKDKVELDGKTMKEEEGAVKRIKGEALKEKDDLGAFIFPIRLEGKVNKNVLADTGSDINTMPYRIYETLGREKINSGIKMINHTQAEAIGKLSNVLCQVGTPGTHDEKARSSRSKRPRQYKTVEEVMLPQVHHEFLLWEGCSRDVKSRKCRVLIEDVVRSLNAPIYCRDLYATMLRDLINSNGKLIPEDPRPGVPRVGIPRPSRSSMQDLYDRMGRIEIRQEAIKHIEYRQSYH